MRGDFLSPASTCPAVENRRSLGFLWKSREFVRHFHSHATDFRPGTPCPPAAPLSLVKDCLVRDLPTMSIEWKILGNPGADNALFVTVDSGQAVDHLLFDCGEGCLNALRPGQIKSIDHLA